MGGAHPERELASQSTECGGSCPSPVESMVMDFEAAGIVEQR